MKTIKVLKEELLAKSKELEQVAQELLAEDLAKEKRDELMESYNSLKEDEETITQNLALAQEDEQRRAKIASMVAGAPLGTGEQKEMSRLASEVNFAKACATKIDEGKELDGIEAEVQAIADAEKEASGIKNLACYQEAPDNRMITIPQSFIQYGNQVPDGKGGHRAATVTVTGEGTDTVQTDIRSIVPALALNPVLMRSGANVLTGLVGDQQWPLGSSLTMAYEGETDSEADATATFTNTSISPKRLGGFIPVSWKFMKQVPTARGFFNSQLERYTNITMDAAGFHGATDGPTGIESTTGVTEDSFASASALTWAKIVSLKATVKEANGDAAMSAYYFPADVWEQAMTTFRNTGTSADVGIINENSNTIAGSRFFVTESVTNDATTDSNNAYVFYGDPTQVYFGFWGGIDLLYDPYTSAASATSKIHCNIYHDIVLVLGGSWSFCDNVLIS